MRGRHAFAIVGAYVAGRAVGLARGLARAVAEPVAEGAQMNPDGGPGPYWPPEPQDAPPVRVRPPAAMPAATPGVRLIRYTYPDFTALLNDTIDPRTGAPGYLPAASWWPSSGLVFNVSVTANHGGHFDGELTLWVVVIDEPTGPPA